MVTMRMDSEWTKLAKCQEVPNRYDIFYPAHENKSTVERAFHYCRQCLVQMECRQWAIDHDEQGIWGKTTEDERKEIRANVAFAQAMQVSVSLRKTSHEPEHPENVYPLRPSRILVQDIHTQQALSCSSDHGKVWKIAPLKLSPRQSLESLPSVAYG